MSTAKIPGGPWLNVGSGAEAPEGWINLDGSWQASLAGKPRLAALASRLTGRPVGHWPRGVRHWDLRRGLGFESGSVSVVYSSHTLEHLRRDEALSLLREAHRVLAPGGVCRVVVPDLDAIVGFYLAHRDRDREPHEPTPGDLLVDMLGMGSRSPGTGLLGWYRQRTDFDRHKWMYEGESLLGLFAEAGFEAARMRDYLESDLPVERLALVEKAARVLDGAGICAEARR